MPCLRRRTRHRIQRIVGLTRSEPSTIGIAAACIEEAFHQSARIPADLQMMLCYLLDSSKGLTTRIEAPKSDPESLCRSDRCSGVPGSEMEKPNLGLTELSCSAD